MEPKVKGILKTEPDDIQRPDPGVKWDEMNILLTHHPADKDYGHMKIDEPKTPYEYDMPDDEEEGEGAMSCEWSPNKLDQETLFSKLEDVNGSGKRALKFEEQAERMSLEESTKEKDFSKKRSAHYNEYQVMKAALQNGLLSSDEEEEEDMEAEVQEEVKQVPSEEEPKRRRSVSITNVLPETKSNPDFEKKRKAHYANEYKRSDVNKIDETYKAGNSPVSDLINMGEPADFHIGGGDEEEECPQSDSLLINTMPESLRLESLDGMDSLGSDFVDLGGADHRMDRDLLTGVLLNESEMLESLNSHLLESQGVESQKLESLNTGMLDSMEAGVVMAEEGGIDEMLGGVVMRETGETVIPDYLAAELAVLKDRSDGLEDMAVNALREGSGRMEELDGLLEMAESALSNAGNVGELEDVLARAEMMSGDIDQIEKTSSLRLDDDLEELSHLYDDSALWARIGDEENNRFEEIEDQNRRFKEITERVGKEEVRSGSRIEIEEFGLESVEEDDVGEALGDGAEGEDVEEAQHDFAQRVYTLERVNTLEEVRSYEGAELVEEALRGYEGAELVEEALRGYREEEESEDSLGSVSPVEEEVKEVILTKSEPLRSASPHPPPPPPPPPAVREKPEWRVSYLGRFVFVLITAIVVGIYLNQAEVL